MEPEPEPSFLYSYSDMLLLNVDWSNGILPIILVLILIVCSALISGSEVAFFSLTHNEIDEIRKENGKSPAGQRVMELMSRPAYLLATILITNNFINIGIIILSTLALNTFLPEGSINWILDWILKVVVVTFILVLFGEVSPKVYAKLQSMKLAKFMSRPLLILRQFLFPLSAILVKSSTIIERRLHGKTGNAISASEIDQAIELTVRQEQGSQQEVDILKSLLRFNHITVKQIMKSRVDVKTLDFSWNYKEVMDYIKEWGYSRMPVYDEDFDHIVGIFYIKDLLEYSEEDDDFEWQGLSRTDVLYVPETKKLNDLLKEFQEKRQHMAIVVDEYGGSSGIVTLEDVMEEVIGDIKDEFDTQREIDFQKINAYTYVFEGKTMLNDIARILDIDVETFEEPRGEADSIAGLLLEVFGYIPSKGKSIKVKGYTFEVETSTRKRIEKIRMILPR